MKTLTIRDKKMLVTGAAGFIGSNLVMRLLRNNEQVEIIGIDNLNNYYDVSIKEWRLREIDKIASENKGSVWKFVKGDISDKRFINEIFLIINNN